VTQYYWAASGADGTTPVGLTNYGASNSTDWTINTVAGAKAARGYRAGSALAVYGLSLDAVDADANRATVEVWGKAYTQSTSQSNNGLMFVRGSGAAGSETCYLLEGTQTATKGGNRTAFGVYKMVGGTATSIGGLLAKTSVWSAGQQYQFRFRVSGTALMFRTWLDGASEPSTWDISITDATISAAGKIGIASRAIDIAYSIFAFGVGTGGDSAPTSAVSAITASDSLSLTDAVSVKAAVPASDSLSLTDAVSVKAAVPASDSLSLSEDLSVAASVPASDSLSLTDAVSVKAAVPASDSLSLSDAVSVAASVPVDDTLSLSEDLSVFKTVSQVLSVALFKTLQRSVKTAPVCRKMEAYARQVSVSLGLSQKSAQASPTFRRAIFTLE